MNEVNLDQLTPLQRAALTIKQMRRKIDALEQRADEPIAIIGIGCRFPRGAHSPDAFWQLLQDGTDAIGPTPATRWSLEDYYDADPEAQGKMYVREAGFLDSVDQFDPQFFGISPREAIGMDPQHRLLLETSWEALEHAGQAPPTLRETATGVFVGVSFDDYLQVSVPFNDPAHLDLYTSLGNYKSVAAGRIAYVLGLQGPAIQLDTACSSSLLAVHLACQSLRNGECHLALAGGVNVMLSPLPTIGFCQLKALSPDGRCKTFDASANGYGRGEGCGMVVLKRLSEAIADDDPILAVIRGSAANHDGPSSGLTVPNQQAQEKLIAQALHNSRAEGHQIGYVEAHGTGTFLGDPIEIAALNNVLCNARPSDQPLLVGSVKTNIGHLESAAGIAALIKTVLALQHGQVPPHLHFNQPNPHVAWADTPIQIPTHNTPWPTDALAGVSSFGISGTNVHVILEAAPHKTQPQPTVARGYLLALSAKTAEALLALIKQYITFLEKHPQAALADLCFTANAGRAHFAHRVAVTADSTASLMAALRTAAPSHAPRPPSVAFLFAADLPLGTGRDLYQHHPLFRTVIERCAPSRAFIDRLYGSETTPPLSAQERRLVIFATQYALAKLWQSWGIEPVAVLGHGVGEYAAAYVAGILSEADALQLALNDGRSPSPLTLHPPHADFVSGRTGEIANETAATPPYWTQQPAPSPTTRGLDALRAQSDIVLEMAQQVEGTEETHWHRCLGQLYTQGASIEWSNVYPRGQRIHLPTYPFQRQRYWVEPQPRQHTTRSLPPDDGHPFLGQRLRSAAFGHDEIVFEAQITADVPTFLNHHQIFGRIVVPGATYIEMALAAVNQQTGSDNLELRDVVIQRPLLLEADTAKTIQIVTTSNAPYTFEVFSLENEAWVSHATGHVVVQKESARPHIADIKVLQQLIATEIPVADHYQFLASKGAEYGPLLRSIAQLWRNAAQGEALGRIQLAEALLPECPRYQLHPALLDACFQVVVAALPDLEGQKTYMPVGVQQLRYHHPPTPHLWSHARRQTAVGVGEAYLLDVSLYTPDGQLVVEVIGMQAKRATAKALRGTAVWRDWLYQVAWHARPYFGSSWDQLPAITTSALSETTATEPATPAEALLGQLEALSVQYILFTLSQMGLTWQAGRRWRTEQMAQQVRIIPTYHRLFIRLLVILAEAGILQQEGEAWHVVQTPPVEDPAAEMAALRAKYGAQPELTLLARCGAALGEVLHGTQEPLALLFPDGDTTDVGQLYTDSADSQMMNRLVQETIRQLVTHLPTGQGLRLLEIGAGTGGTTAGVLPLLPPLQTEYLFTDIGATFLNQAQAQFASYDFMSYRPLDIEQTPSEQGFARHQADVVIAANVLHATRHLPETLAHVRQLLKPSGQLVLVEATSRHCWVDLTFGLTAGWWRFADERQDHPLLTPTQWEALLLDNGFEAVEIVTWGGQSLILARATAISDPAVEQGATWLLLADKQGVGAAVAEQLRQRGESVALVSVGAQYEQIDENSLVIDPHCAENYHQLLQSFSAVKGVVHLWSLDAPKPQEGVDLVGAARASYDSTLLLIQAMLQAHIEPSGFWLVTHNSQATSNEETVSGIVSSGLWGMGKTMALEQAEFKGTLVDLDSRMRVLEQAQRLSDELMQEESEDQVALRSHGRYVARLARHTPVHGQGEVLIDAEATYLITGGLGGLGLVVAAWLVGQGARHLLLLGRRPPTPAAQKQIEALRQRGAVVTVVQANVTIWEEMVATLEHVDERHPLRGVIHSVGVLDDGPLAQQTWAQFEKVLRPKMQGAWHLHQLTRTMPLDFFVLFSSAASLLGSAGQANHAAANAFLDSLAAYRRSQGLAGLSINWGAWSHVGSAVERLEKVAAMGMGSIAPHQGLDTLHYLLRQETAAQVGVVPIDWAKFNQNSSFWADFARHVAEQTTVALPEKILTLLENASSTERPILLERHIMGLIERVLHLPTTAIDLTQGFFDMGMDSLTSVELRKQLQTSLNCSLSSTVTFDHPTIPALTAHLLEKLALETPQPVLEKPLPPSEQHNGPSASTADLDPLSTDELAALLAQELAQK